MMGGYKTGMRKKITMATWDAPNDPSCFLRMDFDVTKTNDYIKRLREKYKDDPN